MNRQKSTKFPYFLLFSLWVEFFRLVFRCNFDEHCFASFGTMRNMVRVHRSTLALWESPKNNLKTVVVVDVVYNYLVVDIITYCIRVSSNTSAYNEYVNMNTVFNAIVFSLPLCLNCFPFDHHNIANSQIRFLVVYWNILSVFQVFLLLHLCDLQ